MCSESFHHFQQITDLVLCRIYLWEIHSKFFLPDEEKGEEMRIISTDKKCHQALWGKVQQLLKHAEEQAEFQGGSDDL